MEAIFLISRILFAFLLLGSAFGHLTQADAMGGYASSKGLPNGKVLAQVSGVALLVGGLSILLGIYGDAGSLGIAVLLLIMAVTMHAFWKETDAQAKQMEMISFNKDVALAGGALAMYVVFYGADGFGFFTITGALFNN
jgi:putative oxidoreductase